MLQAVKNGKTGHSIDEQGVPWRELFKGSEDSLTASVFERLFYLEASVFWSILKASISDPRFPDEKGDLEEVEFWPHWDAKDTTNSNFIEPDVFIRTADFDIIVEAKKKGSGQYFGQWKNEIIAYRNTYGENKRCYLIALEGNYSSGDSKIENVPILKTDWQSVLNAVTKELKFLESSEDSSLSRVRILKDLVIAFEIHGYITCSWFSEMQPVKIETNELSFFAKIDLKS